MSLRTDEISTCDLLIVLLQAIPNRRVCMFCRESTLLLHKPASPVGVNDGSRYITETRGLGFEEQILSYLQLHGNFSKTLRIMLNFFRVEYRYPEPSL